MVVSPPSPSESARALAERVEERTSMPPQTIIPICIDAMRTTVPFRPPAVVLEAWLADRIAERAELLLPTGTTWEDDGGVLAAEKNRCLHSIDDSD